MELNTILRIAAYACIFSIAGSFLTLRLVEQAKACDDIRQRLIKLLVAAIIFGGLVIATVQFIIMVIFTAEISIIVYGWASILISLSASVCAAFIVLSLPYFALPHSVRLALQGLIMAAGITASHYTGIVSLQLNGMLEVNFSALALSYAVAVIGVVAVFGVGAGFNKSAQMLLGSLILGVTAAITCLIQVNTTKVLASQLATAPSAGAFNSIATLSLVGVVIGALMVGLAVSKIILPNLARLSEERSIALLNKPSGALYQNILGFRVRLLDKQHIAS